MSFIQELKAKLKKRYWAFQRACCTSDLYDPDVELGSYPVWRNFYFLKDGRLCIGKDVHSNQEQADQVAENFKRWLPANIHCFEDGKKRVVFSNEIMYVVSVPYPKNTRFKENRGVMYVDEPNKN